MGYIEDFKDDLHISHSVTNIGWKVDDDKLIKLNDKDEEVYFYHINYSKHKAIDGFFVIALMRNVYNKIFGWNLIKDKQVVKLSIGDRISISQVLFDKLQNVNELTMMKSQSLSTERRKKSRWVQKLEEAARRKTVTETLDDMLTESAEDDSFIRKQEEAFEEDRREWREHSANEHVKAMKNNTPKEEVKRWEDQFDPSRFTQKSGSFNSIAFGGKHKAMTQKQAADAKKLAEIKAKLEEQYRVQNDYVDPVKVKMARRAQELLNKSISTEDLLNRRQMKMQEAIERFRKDMNR